MNTVHAESTHGLRDYSPMVCKYGEFYLWDGVNLHHGNVINTSDDTRVSVDARVVPLSLYKDEGKTSININVPFTEGGYYKRMKYESS